VKRGWVCAAVRLLLSIVLMSTLVSVAAADARLLHFDMPASERIPGHYYVLFKTEPELRQLPRLFADPRSGVKKPRVLPDIRPTTAQTSRALAEALAVSVHGRVLPPYESPYEGRQGFWIKLPDNMVSILAKDPRIESLEPSAIVRLSFAEHTLHERSTALTKPPLTIAGAGRNSVARA
jgi:hypothetical protein